MSRNDWHEAKMGTCGCGRWAKVLDDMCAECHDAEQQDQKEAAYLKRIRELESDMRQALHAINVEETDAAKDILRFALEPPR